MADPTPELRASTPGPLEEALASVGDRWTLLVVAALLDGPRRFGDLQRALPGIAPNVLSGRLRHLEEQGLVVAQPYSKRPPRYVYELTGAGGEPLHFTIAIAAPQSEDAAEPERVNGHAPLPALLVG